MPKLYVPSMTTMVWMVVMGVSGCGKSSLGAALAQACALPLIEGDDFHPAENVSKMRAGIPLTDADRADWLATLGRELAARPQGAVLTCSALKRDYRERLRSAVPGLRFVFMELTREESERRVASRAGAHMFPASLVANQFATLESPVGEAGVLAVDATAPMAELVAQVRAWLPKA
ncbi:gluconokinase [Variovorax saccharolyticus]|uniref:gluconokinase n=2 Tax=Variovorax saccharolyticus TaxID=3053516 RepID=UPI002577EA90|nr:gluconokinase [Variovorax sp. J31P216]MDM0027154.1 gluconokinase [Variovorax sp. J31P216]